MEDPTCPLGQGLTPDSMTPFNRLGRDVYNEWLRKKAYIESKSIALNWVWECAYIKQRKEDPDLCQYLEHHYEERPLNRLKLRQSLRGGRCESTYTSLKFIPTGTY